MGDISTATLLTAYLGSVWAHLPAASWFEVPFVLSFVPDWIERVRSFIACKVPARMKPILRQCRLYGVIAIPIASLFWANFQAFSEAYAGKIIAEKKIETISDYQPEIQKLQNEIKALSRKPIKKPLTEDQVKKMKESIEKRKGQAPWAPVLIDSTFDNSTGSFVEDMMRVFSESGLEMRQGNNWSGESPENKGIVIYIDNLKSPSPQAKLFMDILTDASLPYQTRPWVTGASMRAQSPAVPDFIVGVTVDGYSD